ncbi:GNAT family acetyltransferase [Aquibaculum arenosum]|uniref:GNAT family acetyltransferase n=1 Tax=Aquibaculum arenosum TaxID=3032591 RepID=A0ABT5YLY7_9PROT|nr:GNAT family acetyltransferase [Fodinicurvata sp. CAU 1616]MDF2095846.1 GNAT family acetyltransferase [Fodinicurvata sp. CAU 1616]
MSNKKIAPLYRLRPAQGNDTPALSALWQRCGLTVPHNDPEADIALFQASADAEILLAEREGEIVGSLCVGHDGHRGWYYYLAVDPALQRRGLGRHLVQEGERWLKQRGLRKVQLMIRPTNARVRAFYKSCGYDLTPRLVMARWLDGEETPAPESGADVEVVVTHLEMDGKPALQRPHPSGGHKLALLRAEQPPLDFYRFLYRSVGSDCLWWERLALDDAALAATIHDHDVAIYVLYVDGVPAGFSELDSRPQAETPRTGERGTRACRLTHLGLAPAFRGRGLGAFLLHETLELAWDQPCSRLLLSVTTLDSPSALTLCQRMGFALTGREQHRFPDPRGSGLLPPNAGI